MTVVRAQLLGVGVQRRVVADYGRHAVVVRTGQRNLSPLLPKQPASTLAHNSIFGPSISLQSFQSRVPFPLQKEVSDNKCAANNSSVGSKEQRAGNSNAEKKYCWGGIVAVQPKM